MSRMFFKRVRIWSTVIFFSSLAMLGWSLADKDFLGLIIESFFAGMALMVGITNRLLERQFLLIDDLLSQNLDLIGKNRTLIELNLALAGGLAPELPASMPPSKPSMH